MGSKKQQCGVFHDLYVQRDTYRTMVGSHDVSVYFGRADLAF